MESKSLFLAVVCVFLVHNVLAESSKNVSSSNPILSKPSKDELYIDDLDNNGDDNVDSDDLMLGTEGSGMNPSSKGTGAEDMESSGSGYGPDDEDAQVSGKNKGKSVPDDEDDGNDEDEDEDSDIEGLDKLPPKPATTTAATISTTSTTTTTTENDELESRILELPKQKSKVDDFNEASLPGVPEVPQTTSTSTLLPPLNGIDEHSGNGVYISPNSHPERTSSFFAQPGILAAVIGGAVVGLLCAILVVMFIVYRMRKKDEGSYPLEETKRSPAANPYLKSTHREFYA